MSRRFAFLVLTLSLTFLLAVIASFAYAQENQRSRELQARYDEILNSDSPRNAPTIESLARLHFVFVGGFGNEFARDYFATNAQALRAMGAGDVTLLMPNSRNSVEDNIPHLRDRILEVYRDGGRRKLVLIPHSKATLETLGVLIQYPELAKKRGGVIESVIAVQGPLSGCDIGTCVSNAFRKIALGPEVAFFRGLHSLSNAEIQRVISDPIAALPAATRRMLSERVFYVTSEQVPGSTARFVRLTAYALTWGFGQVSDGLVEVEHMTIPGFGKVLGTLRGDHLEFFITPSLYARLLGASTGTVDGVWAFTQAVIQQYVELREEKARTRSQERIRLCRDLFVAL